MNVVGVVTFLLTVTAVTFADEHCQGFIVNNHCYFTIIGNFNLEVARQQCDSAQAQLAVIKTEQVFEATKAYVRANYDHSSKYNVFWMDQSFDYDVRKYSFILNITLLKCLYSC